MSVLTCTEGPTAVGSMVGVWWECHTKAVHSRELSLVSGADSNMPRPIRASREGAVVYTLIPTPTFVLEGGGFFCTYPHRPANFAIGGASSARWFGCGLAVWRTAGLVKKRGHK